MPNQIPKVGNAPSMHGDVSYSFAEPATPGLDFTSPSRRLWVGITGNIVAVMAGDGAQATFTNVPVGWFEINATKLISVVTTADEIVVVF